MKTEKFHAVADVWAVPTPHSSKYYLKDWGKPLFSCYVSVDPTEGETEVLRVKLEDRKNHSLLAVAPYDGQHGISSVVDSARHYVLTIRNPQVDAWLGIGFRDPADSIDFSLAIQTFMRRRMFENRLSSPGWLQRKAANMAPRKVDPPQYNKLAPLISPPPTDSASSSELSEGSEGSEEEFGEFQ